MVIKGQEVSFVVVPRNL